jgi:hypothetical protein
MGKRNVFTDVEIIYGYGIKYQEKNFGIKQIQNYFSDLTPSAFIIQSDQTNNKV